MGVPLAESFSAPALLEETAEARSKCFCQHQRILSPFFHSGNKKNEDLFGIWIWALGFYLQFATLRADVEFERAESATATGCGNNPRPGFNTGWSRDRQNSRDHL